MLLSRASGASTARPGTFHDRIVDLSYDDTVETDVYPGIRNGLGSSRASLKAATDPLAAAKTDFSDGADEDG